MVLFFLFIASTHCGLEVKGERSRSWPELASLPSPSISLFLLEIHNFNSNHVHCTQVLTRLFLLCLGHWKHCGTLCRVTVDTETVYRLNVLRCVRVSITYCLCFSKPLFSHSLLDSLVSGRRGMMNEFFCFLVQN